MNLDGVLADLEFFCNVAVAQALVEHDEQLFLALGQFFGCCAGFGVGVVEQENLQGVGDFSGACRLGHVSVCAGFNRQVFKVTGRRGRKHQEWNAGVALLDFAHTRHAVGVWQLQVQADELRNAMGLNGGGNGCDSVELNDFGVAVDSAYQHHNRFAHQGVVINNKNAHKSLEI